MTKIYNYSPVTGEFINAVEAEVSPLDPSEILIPAYATTIAPPAYGKNEIAVFSNGEWTVHPDFRGMNYWMPDFSFHFQSVIGPLPVGATTMEPENHKGTTYWLPDGSQHVMDTLGPLPDGATTTPPPPTKAETIAKCENAIQTSLDMGALAWGYQSIVAAASYAASTNAQYAADAAALIQWRDDAWNWAIPLLPNVNGGDDVDAFVANMPKQPAKPKV